MRRWRRARVVAVVALAVAAAGGASRIALSAAGGDDACAPQHLRETGLYAADRAGAIDARNLPFSPQYPLWSDGAKKSRWVYLPPGTVIDGSDAAEWRFPVGTRFWKEFTFNGRKVETRMLWKASGDRWVAASYVWNADQTDAVLAPDDGVPNVADVAPGRTHGIPSRTECFACHGERRTAPLGFNLLQLSPDRDPNAIHGETLTSDMVTLRSLLNGTLLSPAGDALANAPRIRTANPRTRAALGYLATNCGSCHNGGEEIGVSAPSLKLADLLNDGDAVARALVGRETAWQVPGARDGHSALVDPENPELSAILVRMGSRRPSTQMPPLGTVVRDREAVDALRRWIMTDLASSR